MAMILIQDLLVSFSGILFHWWVQLTPTLQKKNTEKHSLAVSQTLDFTEQAKNLRAT